MGHAPLFGLLAMWIALASRRVRAKNGFVWVPLGTFQRSTITAGVLLWGVIDELHQASTPGRHASFWDLLTDGVSAWMVLWVAAGVGAAGITEGALVKRLLWSAAASMTAALAATLY